MLRCILAIYVLVIAFPPYLHAQISTIDALIEAVENGEENDLITLSAGTFTLAQPLQLKKGMHLKGAGTCQTIITGEDSWEVEAIKKPDNEIDHTTVNRNAYLIDLGTRKTDVTISDLTLRGPLLHGGIYGNDCDGLEVHHVKLESFRWSGIRTFRMNDAKIHDNIFENAGGKAGPTGGGIFVTYMVDSEIWNNIFYKTSEHPTNFFGIKGRQGRSSRIHHNTINTNFSIEFPFENDHTVEIDHNWLSGVISIPKFAGGPVPENGFTFHIHHNYFTTSYALEWPRNGTEVDHNLFDFDTEKDYGNLISNFASEPGVGPTFFHNNLIKNPGRGIMWHKGVFDNIQFYNNHVIANQTITPRKEGLFGFNTKTNFKTITIKDNIIECIGLERPLMRNEESYKANIENNQLIGISDINQFQNAPTGNTQGPTEPLNFSCGAYNTFTVKDWNITGTFTPPSCSDSPSPSPENGIKVSIKVWLEGFLEPGGQKMRTTLNQKRLIPIDQPYQEAPFQYAGKERAEIGNEGIVDWILVEIRDKAEPHALISTQAALLAQNGTIKNTALEELISFPNLKPDEYVIAIRHKSHLAILSSSPLSLSGTPISYDFTTAVEQAGGKEQLKPIKGTFAMYSGDYDQNGLINNQDYNLWRQKGAQLNEYLAVDVDGNGIVNNSDFNFWAINKSKIGQPNLR